MPRQSDLRFTFEPLQGDAFDVVSFTLDEGLSKPFKLQLELASGDPAVDFNRLLDLPAVFTLWRGQTPIRHVHGLVSRLSQGDTGFRRTRYEVELEPLLARATLSSNWRIFQHKSVPEIITTVLKGLHLTDVQLFLRFPHQPREYCVQAGETDFDFIARLAAEEGLLYTFEHRRDGHLLFITDDVTGVGAIEGGSVNYQPMAGGDAHEPALRRFHYSEQVRTARQVQRDYSFTHPRYNQQHTADGGPALKNQHKDYERYDYPGRYKRDAAGKPFTRTRLAALRSDAIGACLVGDDARLQPGMTFDLQEHPRADLNDRWRSVHLKHTGKQHSSLLEEAFGSDSGTSYELEGTAIRWNAEWKAPLHAKPRIDGPQVATVVGPPGEEIYCDEWGRVKVCFPWDRRDRQDEYSSCWIRVAQGWAGTLWGAMAVPRVGQELIISYLDGDPDQPIATGRTYRATHLPPYELPRHKTRMTIKSRTHKGQGFNELRFEDEKGQEELYLHAERDQNTEVGHDQGLQVGHDRRQRVGHDEYIETGNDRHLAIHGNSHSQVDGEQQHRVKGTRTTVVETDDHLEVGGSRSLKVSGRFGLDSGRQIHLQAGDEIVLDAGVSLTLQAGGHCLRLDPAGIHSSVALDLGAAPSVLASLAAVEVAIPLTFLRQVSREGALLINSCEFDTHGNCKLHPHH
ncbi:type VI secretion system Vgr family protein [Pseudomonas vanderleydeniana]|uniref:Type VI secretion system tip protein VgrG n=1 Tax=Pseudomonas vanderleydeniana TaxID=2745495 RepID=A0A9E6PQ33_9PSED|nr:type VI secretion system tip protein TssI/VgrG [Pseudomonas vanderleydeniana]QXI30589.1 type VI secretion system tip protein VgrG [Pseudomonas vanderleydeniana]